MTTPKAYLFVFSLLVFHPLLAQQEFQHLVGDNLNNSYQKVIEHNGSYFILGSEQFTQSSLQHATFSKVDANGRLEWMLRLDIPSQWNDLVITDEGRFLLVGGTLPYNNQANSLMALATDEGSFLWSNAYNLGLAESLSSIIRNPRPQDSSTPYYVSGKRSQTSSVEDVMLLQIDNGGRIGRAQLIGQPNGDEEFHQMLGLSNGGLLFYGNHGEVAVTYRTDNRGNIINGQGYASNMRIDHAIPDANGGFMLAGRRNRNTLAQITKVNENQVPQWSQTIPQLDKINQIWKTDTGLLYALGFGRVNGVARNILLQLTDGPQGTHLNWAKTLDDGSVAYQNGGFSLLSNNKIIYVDGRENNDLGFGHSDALVSVSNPDFETCITTEAIVTINPINVPSNNYFNIIAPLQVAPPQALGWGRKTAETAIVCQSLLLLSPLGEIDWQPGQALEFDWTAYVGYFGKYRLKIAKLAPNDPVPSELPDVGLFFDQTDIDATSFLFSSDSAPFEEGGRYVWQVETVELVNGERRKSQLEVITFSAFGSCNFSITGLPITPLCPGDCFTLEAQFPLFTFFHRLIVYSDHPNLLSITVGASGISPYPLSDLNATFLETPVHYAGSSNTASVEICMNEGLDVPVNFSVYYYRSGSFCSINPLSPFCCHDIENFTIDVADIPDYTHLELEVKNVTTSANLTEICSGDPALFSILNFPTSVNAPVHWQFNDGFGWQDILTDPFSMSYTFSVNPYNSDVLEVDCQNSTTGFIDRLFRAKVTVSEGETTCEYFTTEYPLRICCPLTDGSLSLSTTDSVDLDLGICPGDIAVLTLNVALNSAHLFVNTPGEFVNISWYLNGAPLSFDDQNNFTITVPIGTEDIELKAVVTNCAGKSMDLEQCIHLETPPDCGTISSSTYEVCPGGEAILTATDFTDCIMHWEYSFDLISWFPLGTSNTIQNTNTIIPDPYTSIFYRIRCEPMLDEGGCDPAPTASACSPCHSNIIQIQEKQPPMPPQISCPSSPACSGETMLLYVFNGQANGTYTWYVDGLAVGTGNSLSIVPGKSSCYWVELTDECFVVSSEVCCFTFCEVIAAISCPLPPNECACLNQEIELTAVASQSSCEPSQLAYSGYGQMLMGIHKRPPLCPSSIHHLYQERPIH